MFCSPRGRERSPRCAAGIGFRGAEAEGLSAALRSLERLLLAGAMCVLARLQAQSELLAPVGSVAPQPARSAMDNDDPWSSWNGWWCKWEGHWCPKPQKHIRITGLLLDVPGWTRVGEGPCSPFFERFARVGEGLPGTSGSRAPGGGGATGHRDGLSIGSPLPSRMSPSFKTSWDPC